MKHLRRFSLLLLLVTNALMAHADIYYVQFTDKAQTLYRLDQPLQYLSQRALDRRAKWNIAIDSTDIPVNPQYVQGLINAGGVVKQTTRWMNGALVVTSSTAVVDSIEALPYVKFVELVYISRSGLYHQRRELAQPQNEQLYGDSYTQLQMLGVDQLHSHGFNGDGIHIAVIDAGFENVNNNPAFDSLRTQGGILGTKDFVNPSSNIYNEDMHGAVVLATMAANLPGEYLGGAPKASYWLLRSEEAATEWPVEADYWVAAAEFADSVGADIITSSLGYAMFDSPSFDYKYSDLNGRTLRISRAALQSARKGMVTLISAGNEGADDWGTISAPADADSILTVGAVTRQGQYAYFSSYGPSADGRVKPDICTVGQGASTVSTYGYVFSSNGTSYSCPIAAGMMACIMQALPNMRPQDLIQAIRESASVYHKPDNYYGYGIPNAWTVYSKALGVTETKGSSTFCHYPNPVENMLYIKLEKPAWVVINDLMGRHYLHTVLQPETPLNLSSLQTGIYIITVNDGDNNASFRIIKQ